MPLTDDQRDYVLTQAVDILRHPRRDQLLALLEQRIEGDDYPDPDERDLDQIVLAIAHAIDEQLT